jgi:hypothetical protein
VTVRSSAKKAATSASLILIFSRRLISPDYLSAELGGAVGGLGNGHPLKNMSVSDSFMPWWETIGPFRWKIENPELT